MERAFVTIDFMPESVARYRTGYAVVAIDVIRAPTTLATGTALGRRCHVAPDVEQALARAAAMQNPLLVGEKGGDMPQGFDMTNSPAALALRTDIERPMVLVSSSGTRLIDGARCCEAAYLACFRNWRAVAERLCGRHPRIAVIGAGTRSDFREEDQMCCAWIAGYLIERGYAADARTLETVARWKDAPADACLVSASVAYLRRSNQLQDLEFVLSHVDDLRMALMLDGHEVIAAKPLELVTCGEAAPARCQSELPRYARRVAVLPR